MNWPKEPELDDYLPECGCGQPNYWSYMKALKAYIQTIKKMSEASTKCNMLDEE